MLAATERRLAAGAALAVLAGTVHFVAAYDHLAEGPEPSAFLAAVGIAQIAAGIALTRRPDKPLITALVVGSLALFALFAVAYSVGIPLGPHAGEPEHLGPIVAVSKVIELAMLWLVAPFLAIVNGQTTRRHAPRTVQPSGKQRWGHAPAVAVGAAALLAIIPVWPVAAQTGCGVMFRVDTVRNAMPAGVGACAGEKLHPHNETPLGAHHVGTAGAVNVEGTRGVVSSSINTSQRLPG